MRVRMLFTVIVMLVVMGCGHAASPGVVAGHFRLPGRPAADLQRAGLNFAKGSDGVHGNGSGRTVQVSADGRYTVTLSPGSYSVIGGLSGRTAEPAAEKCTATMNVVVRSNSTTRADYVCRSIPATSRSPAG